MSTSDLAAILRGTTSTLAGLSGFTLDSVHWDERDRAVTAALEGPLGDNARAEADGAPEHDWVRFWLRFPAVNDFQVGSWSHEPADGFEYVPDGDRLSMTITGPATDVRFTSDPVIVVRHRTSRAAPS